MSDRPERRSAVRAKIDLPVRYSVDDGPERTGTVDNLSRGGLLLVAGEAIGEKKQLRIAFQDAHNRTHTIVGEVVRSAPVGRLGVSFVHIEDATLDYVRTVLGVP